METKTESLPRLEAKVKPYSNAAHEGLLGFAELVIGDSFVIKDIAIRRSKTGQTPGKPFLSFPARRSPGEEYKQKYFSIAHAVTPEAHKAATEAVLEAYRRAGGN